jgi:hypothetical protein
MISDRDVKFTSAFWKAVLQKHGVKGAMTTAYHPAADGQSERTNQTVETALRCLLVGENEETWINLIPEIELALKIVKNRSTNHSPFEVVYGFRPKLLTTLKSDVAEVQEFAERRS